MAYNDQIFTPGQPITAAMIDYIDNAVDRLDEIFGDYKFKVLTGSEYNSLSTKDANTLYYIKEAVAGYSGYKIVAILLGDCGKYSSYTVYDYLQTTVNAKNNGIVLDWHITNNTKIELCFCTTNYASAHNGGRRVLTTTKRTKPAYVEIGNGTWEDADENYRVHAWIDVGTKSMSSQSNFTGTIANKTKHRVIVDFKNKTASYPTINNSTLTHNFVANSDPNDKIQLIGYNDGTANNGFAIYYLKIWENGTLVREYVPAKTKEGVSGLVDLVNDNFFTNSAGSGSNLEAKNF